MADVMEHVAYLSQEIGPRPAGTEEEQQAALYITEHMQKEAGLPAVIEDFTGVANTEIPRAICSGITLAFTILAVALPVVALPAAIVAILSAAVYVAEAFDKPILSRLLRIHPITICSLRLPGKCLQQILLGQTSFQIFFHHNAKTKPYFSSFIH